MCFDWAITLQPTIALRVCFGAIIAQGGSLVQWWLEDSKP
jgi:hypothetical protein